MPYLRPSHDKQHPMWSGLTSLTRDVLGVAKRLTDSVVEATNDFEREQRAFVEQKPAHEREHTRLGAEAVPPWEGLHNADELRTQILALSADKRNFLVDPPSGTEFAFDMAVMFPIAKTIMDVDARLADMRFQLVPKQVAEPAFWRNYFYRVSLIKQSAQLSMQLNTSAAPRGEGARSPASASAEPDKSASASPTTAPAAPTAKRAAAAEEDEFISDSVMHQRVASPGGGAAPSPPDDFEHLEAEGDARRSSTTTAGEAGGSDDFDLEKELENELRGYSSSGVPGDLDDEVLL